MRLSICICKAFRSAHHALVQHRLHPRGERIRGRLRAEAHLHNGIEALRGLTPRVEAPLLFLLALLLLPPPLPLLPMHTPTPIWAKSWRCNAAFEP